jgi:hypothetical protein
VPSLLVDASPTKKEGWNSLMHYRYQLAKSKKSNLAKFCALANKLMFDLAEFEKEMENLSK